MALQPVKSSNIDAIGYDDEAKRLTVKFKSGQTHDYHGVDPAHWAKLSSAESVGKYFHAHIRNAHKSSKRDD